MSEVSEKKIFFLHNPKHNLSAVESYLKKRGFSVFCDSNPKNALIKIVEESPEYIFLAWDHPSERIQQLPKVILQSIMATIIPFVFGNDKIANRRLHSAPFPHKVFPPVSGPSIQRLLSKLEKEAALEAEKSQSTSKNKTGFANSKSEMVQVKSTFQSEDMDSFFKELESSKQNPEHIQNEKRMHHVNQIRQRQSVRANGRQGSSMIIAKGNFAQSKTQQRQSQIAYTPDQATQEAPRLNAEQKRNLSTRYESTVQSQIVDLIETFQGSEFSAVNSAVSESTSLCSQGFCLAIECAQWCGYLVIAHENPIEYDSLQSLLSQWVNENLDSTDENSDPMSEAFPLFFHKVNFEEFSQAQADYTKTVEHNSKKTVISFFSINSNYLNIQLHPEHDMIQLQTDELSYGLTQGLDIYFYLNENKKFILYLKSKDSANAHQLQHIKNKKILSVYTPIDFEIAVLQLKAQNALNFMIDEFNAAVGGP